MSHNGHAIDPMEPVTDEIHVRRGGGWNGYAMQCRSASAEFYIENFRREHYNLGFRLALATVH